MRLDIFRWGGYRLAYCLDYLHIYASRRYLIRWALFGEEIDPGHVMPIAELHRANCLRFLELRFAIVPVFVDFLRAVKSIAFKSRRGAVKVNDFNLNRSIFLQTCFM